MTRRAARERTLKSIHHVAGPDQVEFLAGEFFQIVVVVVDAKYTLAQIFIFLLKAEILLVEPDFFGPQTP